MILGLVFALGAGWLALAVAYRDYTNGPSLSLTPAQLSSANVFPLAPEGQQGGVAEALAYADSVGATSVIVLQAGQLVAEFGDTSLKSSVHSVRKSLLSAMYGVAVERGLIDIDRTLASLGIDDHNPPLTETERSATLRSLLTATSGIYHPSIKDDNGPYPAPGAHQPDEAFVYNNWSFNAAGGIFEELTGLSLGEAFAEWFAEPLGMQDFEPEDVRYFEGPESVYPAWRFWVSTRDLARFGQMMLDGGEWQGTQVLPEAWVRASWTPYSETGDDRTGYGYMWWTMHDDSRMATGTGGQKIRVYPDRDVVIVTKVNTGFGFSRALWSMFGPRLRNTDVRLILEHLGV